MANVTNQLESAIAEGFESLGNLEFGSEVYMRGTNAIKELYKLRIEEEKVKNEASDKEKYKEDIRLKEAQLKADERKYQTDAKLREVQIQNEEKRSKRIKPEVILSGVLSTITVIGILLYEKSDVLTTKAINYVPKIKL